MKFKALTISQPFAELIRDGSKFTENRVWSSSYRGPLAIHAGKGMQYLNKDELSKYDTGCIVAIAELVACVRLANLRSLFKTIRDSDYLIEGTRYTLGQVLSHKHSEGPFLWILQDVQSIRPIPMSGKQGLWPLELDMRNVETIAQCK